MINSKGDFFRDVALFALIFSTVLPNAGKKKLLYIFHPLFEHIRLLFNYSGLGNLAVYVAFNVYAHTFALLVHKY